MASCDAVGDVGEFGAFGEAALAAGGAALDVTAESVAAEEAAAGASALESALFSNVVMQDAITLV